jgi:YHS domain-containing protein
MHTRVFVLSVGLAGLLGAEGAAARQHQGHQPGDPAGPSAAQVTECRQSQPVVTNLLNAALRRLEEARLTNSATAMRDAADDVQAALIDVRTQLAPCREMQAATADAHAGHAMPAAPSTPASGAPATASPQSPPPQQRPSAADTHAGHVMPATPVPTRTTPPPAAPAASDAHAGHAKPAAPAPPTSIADLKCTNAVDQKTAPRMLYQGRMYYFCTEASRAEFANDPAKYVTAPPAAAPAHAH